MAIIRCASGSIRRCSASTNFELGHEANQTSDNYVLSTIFFAAC